MNRVDESYNKNPYKLPRVVLASISDEIQLDENLEPPFVRIRSGNTAYLHLDVATGSPLTTSPASRICSSNTVLSRVNRIYLTFLSFRWMTPNINPRNNVFTFFWSTTGLTYSAVLPEQNILGLARWTLLVDQMNAAVGGVTFGLIVGTLPNTYGIIVSVGTWYFLNDSIGVLRGRYLWGVTQANTGVNTNSIVQTFTYFTENYTRYIDVSSFELTQHSKIDSGGESIPIDNLVRYNVNTTLIGQYEFATIDIPAVINFARDRNITTVDIVITDEFRDILYIPRQAWESFSFATTFICEM